MKKKRERRNKLIFGVCTIVSGAAAMLGINALPVMAAEDVGEEMAVGEDVEIDTGADTGAAGELSENSRMGVIAENEDLGVYDFKDNKTTGTITVTKEWSDKRTNSERPEPEIKISTKKPSKSTLGYTVTFHGNKDAGLVFDNGSDVNDVVYNSKGQIVDGAFKVPGGFAAGAVSWFTDKSMTNKIDVNENGTVQMTLNGDVDLWIKTKTFEINGYKYGVKNNNEFNALIPDTVTEIFFTDEIKPENVSVIDVDADGDGGVVAWTENNNTVMKVSTQIKGIKIEAPENIEYMFADRNKLTNIDFSMLDTANVTSMKGIFKSCSGLTSLDLTPLNTAKVTNMGYMFCSCTGITNLDLTPLNTAKVTNMCAMFYGCSGLTSLDLTPLNTANTTNFGMMFASCKRLTSLNVNNFVTSKAADMSIMFSGCSGLTSIDVSSFDTSNVKNMSRMFEGCGFEAIDVSNFNTSNVTNMQQMFYGCQKLKSLDLSNFNTHYVTNICNMFNLCFTLTSLDISSFDTTNVTNMNWTFSNLNKLKTLSLGEKFAFVGTAYGLTGTWANSDGNEFNSMAIPNNVADTYTRVS